MAWLTNVSRNLPDLVWNILVVLTAIFLGLIVKFLIAWFLAFYYRRSDLYLISRITRRLSTVAYFLIPLLFLNFSIPLMKLTKTSAHYLDRWIEVGLIVTFAGVLVGVIKIVEDVIYHKFDYTKQNNLKERKIRTQIQFVRKFVVMIIVLITIAVVLLSFENMRKIGAGLLTGVGVGGIIIGFAAQKSLGNLLAGFQIAFTQPIRIDDVLVVEGEWGRVEEITLTYVVLKIWDQRRLILPINYFIETPFQNWTRTSAELIGSVFIYADHSLPIEPLRKELTRLLGLNKLWDGRVNALQVTDVKTDTIEVRVLVSAKDSGTAFDLRCYIREKLVLFIQQNYPQSLPKLRATIEAGSPLST
ncbi:MAG: mechanosensitive ion channel family protein [Sphingobacteriaceae bacterium]